MAYTTIDDPSAYFQTATYTGDGAGSLAITNTGNSDLQPDWLWIKRRDGAVNHLLHDSVRGVTNLLVSNAQAGDDSNSNIVLGFDSDGFRVGANSASNGNNQTFVAWQWKAGTSFSNDASSTSVGTIDSAGSVSTDAGFSIITYTGTGTAGTIAHGLGKLPKMIIAKQRNSTANWSVYFLDTSIAYNNVRNYLELNTNIASTGDSGARWGAYGNYSTTTFGVGTNAANNASGSTYVAYVFAEKKGYSKFGKHTGNGNADGTFVFTGMKPAWVMIKRTDDTDNWVIYDNKRDGFNGDTHALFPNNSDGQTTDVDIDLLSNGFKIVRASGRVNANGGSFIYMAFAEQPFVTSTGVPATAR